MTKFVLIHIMEMVGTVLNSYRFEMVTTKI